MSEREALVERRMSATKGGELQGGWAGDVLGEEI